MSDSTVEPRLRELAERTRHLGPGSGFQTRVLAVLAQRAQATLRAELVRSARLFVPGGLLLAALALGLAWRADTPSSTDIAVVEQRWESDF